jgi:hypothetical protein
MTSQNGRSFASRQRWVAFAAIAAGSIHGTRSARAQTPAPEGEQPALGAETRPPAPDAAADPMSPASPSPTPPAPAAAGPSTGPASPPEAAPTAPFAEAAPTPPLPEAAQTAAVDEAEAAALLDLSADMESESRAVDFYGFADFTYTFDMGNDSSAPSSFAVGNVNLYAQADLADGWRSLFEVRFMYLPHGTTPYNFDPASPAARTDTTVGDYSDIGHPVRWGGISIQRAWLEHQFHPALTIRGGHFLSPYGIWNVDHGSPVVIGVRRPYVIGEALLPQSQTGLQALGHLGFGPAEFGYHLTLSNGRGPIDTHQDLDSNKAVGGRLYGKLDSHVGRFSLGVSGYRGKYTDSETAFSIADGEFAITTNVLNHYSELSFAADLKWEWEGALVQAEAVVNDIAYDEDHRPLDPAVFGGPPGFAPDHQRRGVYGLAGYRTNFFNLMPFAGVEYYDPGLRSVFTPITVFWVGLNARPTPKVVLKVEYAYVHVSEVSGLPRSDAVKFLETQAAWSF